MIGPTAFAGIVWGSVALVLVVFWYVVWQVAEGLAG